MVDETGQDLVEVEPAADVAGDAAQGVGPMEVVGDLVGRSAGADDRPDARGDRAKEVGVDGRGIGAGVGSDDEDAPERAVDRGSRSRARASRRATMAPGSVAGDDRRRIRGGAARGRRPSPPKSRGSSMQAEVVAAGRGARDEALAAQLVNRDGEKLAALDG